MNVEEVCELIGPRKLARHRGQVFFTIYDRQEAKDWEGVGATVKTDSPGGRFMAEVHPHTLLDQPSEYDEEGNLIDNRREILFSHIRKRDGFTLSIHR